MTQPRSTTPVLDHPPTALSPGVAAFTITTPDDWVVLDLDPDTNRHSTRRLIERSEPNTVASLSPTGIGLARLLEQAADQARSRGAVLASVYARSFEDQAVSASFTAAVTKAATGSGAGADAALVAACLERDPGGRDTITETAVVTLPAGDAARVRRSVVVDVAGHSLTTTVVQYFVPVPGCALMIVLTFSTPVLPLADAFVALFDAVAETLEWR